MRWRDRAKARPAPGVLTDFFRLPFITKREMRQDFPRNFLPPGQTLDALLDQNRVELEHTSGTSEERLPVLFGRGWWNEQEESVLRLNRLVARVLDDHPGARRATLVPPVCNGLTCFAHRHSRSERTVDTTLYVNRSRIPFLLDSRRTGADGRGDFRMVAPISGPGSRARGLVRALLRAAGDPVSRR